MSGSLETISVLLLSGKNSYRIEIKNVYGITTRTRFYTITYANKWNTLSARV